MISKAQIKQVRLLHQKKYRDEKNLFIAEGQKVVNELLNSKYKVKEIFATKQFQVSGFRFHVEEVSENELAQISALTTPHQVLAVVESLKGEKTKSPFRDVELLADELVIALDDISDPGNFGTIIRIADWFGINHLLCSEACVDVYNPKVVQAAMGSIARVDVHYGNLASLMEDVRGQMADVKIYGAVLNGKNIYSEKLSDNGIILIGNESRGISENLLQYVSNKLSIPNFSTGADSLNAAVATAVICSEFRRSGVSLQATQRSD
ncbi:MAG: RNA methyltransferase [Bacteroidota bacterium]